MRLNAESIRVRGLVQGVGFRPTVWQLAQRFGLTGEVLNDGEGVLIVVQGDVTQLDDFVSALRSDCPPLARIDAIEREAVAVEPQRQTFTIAASHNTGVLTGVVADAATCPACLDELRDPQNRRHGYAFTNCTHCGPRFSIIRAIPYDRANTSMAAFRQCPACQREYDNPADRRFHAQPNACPVCGPQVWLEDNNGNRLPVENPVSQAAELIRQGRIVAIKGVGGFHLACDAASDTAVATLRERKHRYAKPLAMMARDLDQVRSCCQVSVREAEALSGSAAPIVILEKKHSGDSLPLAPGIAPGQKALGFMLPYSPLHHLLMADLSRPVVLTSGNRSEEPQCIDNEDARERLSGIADAFLMHDRDIVNRIDDSVVREMAGEIRCLRRGRGMAPETWQLPGGFPQADGILAMGAELKNTFCLLRKGDAILSQHMGDLEDARTLDDYQTNLALYRQLFRHAATMLVIDRHPEYLSSKTAEAIQAENHQTLSSVQHHHAHIAACLGDNGWGLEDGKVIGIALDGLGFGEDDTLWGGEFLLADYCDSERLASFRPMPLIGGAKAMFEPWRNTYAQLVHCL
ncbi:MAG: carbamoyltransferase HypF, partial [Gammaproteobacteria bacterium]|nr:carbamoyltransferase HypF [Gammaproteobacteria bacterium]